jgi:hypothetical protein
MAILCEKHWEGLYFHPSRMVSLAHLVLTTLVIDLYQVLGCLSYCLAMVDDLNRIYDSPSINGSSFGQSLGDWYFHRSVDGKQLIDDCGELPCNHSPGCKTM